MTSAIRTRGLTKRFGSVAAVDDLSLDVPEGELYGFLGPNGSGKTTTLRMLLGLVYATSGEIEMLGRPMPRDSRRVLPHVGALVEGPGFYPHLSARQNLALFDAAAPSRDERHRKERIERALDDVGLGDVGRKHVKAYSSGMRQRLGLAAALLRNHRLLILDEPTNALDPHGAEQIRDLLAKLVAGGMTIIVSSHFLAEVEMICSRAAIVHRGRLIAEGTVDDLLAPTGRVWIRTPDMDAALRHLAEMRGAHVEDKREDSVAVSLRGPTTDQLNDMLVRAGVRVIELRVERPTLEQVFMKLTGPSAPEEANDVPG